LSVVEYLLNRGTIRELLDDLHRRRPRIGAEERLPAAVVVLHQHHPDHAAYHARGRQERLVTLQRFFAAVHRAFGLLPPTPCSRSLGQRDPSRPILAPRTARAGTSRRWQRPERRIPPQPAKHAHPERQHFLQQRPIGVSTIEYY